MVWRGSLVPMGPVSRHDLLSAVCVLIFGQFSALGINLLDRFVTFTSPFGFVPGWDWAWVSSGIWVGWYSMGSPGWANSEEGAFLCTVESSFEVCFLFLFLVLVLGSLESLPFPFDGVPSCVFGRWWGEGDLSIRGWGAVTDVFVA